MAPRRLMPALLIRMSIGPKSRSTSSGELSDARGRRDVDLESGRRAAGVLGQRLGGGEARVDRAAGQRDVGAGVGEGAGHRDAEAHVAAGDEGALALQREQVEGGVRSGWRSSW